MANDGRDPASENPWCGCEHRHRLQLDVYFHRDEDLPGCHQSDGCAWRFLVIRRHRRGGSRLRNHQRTGNSRQIARGDREEIHGSDQEAERDRQYEADADDVLA